MKSLGLLADTRRHASHWRRWVLSLSSRNQNNYRRNSELRISTQTFLTVFQTFTHWSDSKRSRFTQRCFKHLSLNLSFLLKLKKNLSLGKWRWDINNICHLLPAFQFFFFFSSFLSQSDLTCVQSKKQCRAGESDHTAILQCMAEWEIRAIFLPCHAISCFQDLPVLSSIPK